MSKRLLVVSLAMLSTALAAAQTAPKAGDEAARHAPLRRLRAARGLRHLPRRHRPPARAGDDVAGLHPPLGRDRVLRAGACRTPTRSRRWPASRPAATAATRRSPSWPATSRRRGPAETAAPTRAVSCDLCHTITGFEGDTPFNFNWIVASPGKVKQGPRAGRGEPAPRDRARTPSCSTAEFCGTCHNEKNPWGLWVKSTHLEWKEGPHGKAGIVCQDCHMPPAAGRSAHDGRRAARRAPAPLPRRPRPRQARRRDRGAHPSRGARGGAGRHREAHAPWSSTPRPATRSRPARPRSACSGCTWRRRTPRGKTYHLPVDEKGFAGEEFTIASATAWPTRTSATSRASPASRACSATATVPAGDRIFRLPYLDPQGRMTIAQWNTASFGPDYRLAPLAGRRPRPTPGSCRTTSPPGPVTVTADGLLLAARVLGGRVPEGAARGVGSR